MKNLYCVGVDFYYIRKVLYRGFVSKPSQVLSYCPFKGKGDSLSFLSKFSGFHFMKMNKKNRRDLEVVMLFESPKIRKHKSHGSER